MTHQSFETILVEKSEGITWLIMNRPDKRNAMSPQLHLDMDDAHMGFKSRHCDILQLNAAHCSTVGICCGGSGNGRQRAGRRR